MDGAEEHEDDFDYEGFIKDFYDPTQPFRFVGKPLGGAEAASWGREFLLREYGSDEAIQDAIRRGRPPVGSTKQGPSPTVRGRISVTDFAQFQSLKEQTGKTESELVREAVHLLLNKRQAG